MDTYNWTYDGFKKKIVQVRKKHFFNDLASPTFIGERVIVTESRRNTGAIVATNLAFIGATK